MTIEARVNNPNNISSGSVLHTFIHSVLTLWQRSSFDALFMTLTLLLGFNQSQDLDLLLFNDRETIYFNTEGYFLCFMYVLTFLLNIWHWLMLCYPIDSREELQRCSAHFLFSVYWLRRIFETDTRNYFWQICNNLLTNYKKNLFLITDIIGKTLTWIYIYIYILYSWFYFLKNCTFYQRTLKAFMFVTHHFQPWYYTVWMKEVIAG